MPSPATVTKETRVSVELLLLAVTVAAAAGGLYWRLNAMEGGLDRQITVTEELRDAVRSAERERARLSDSIDRLSSQLSRNEEQLEQFVPVTHFFLWIERARMTYPELPGYSPR